VAEVAAPAYLSAEPEPEPQPTPSSSVQQASPSLPSPDNLQGLSASEKMQALQQVQQVSRQALTSMPASNPYYVNAPKTIDIRMYDQLVVAHNKFSQKLSDANAHVGVLEGQINTCNEDLIAAFELMKQVGVGAKGGGGWAVAMHEVPPRCNNSCCVAPQAGVCSVAAATAKCTAQPAACMVLQHCTLLACPVGGTPPLR
jgi:hypothetical protein